MDASDADDAARRSAQLEAAADAVLEGRQLLIDLDRRANATREAANALKRSATANAATPASLFSAPAIVGPRAPGAEAHVWLLVNGGTFVRVARGDAQARLARDQSDTARSVGEARDALKAAVTELARLEGPTSALARLNAGFDLKAAT